MLEVRTGCRLHFGLMELAAAEPHRFAGLGLMIQMPRVCLRVGPGQAVDACRSADAEINARVQAAVEHAQQALGQRLRADWSVAAVEHPRLHSGLGLGTQLAAAAAAATQLAVLRPEDDAQPTADSPWQSIAASIEGIASGGPSEGCSTEACPTELVQRLARISGRGKRSAVGLHGFLFGGLIQDGGQNVAPAAEQPPSSRSPRPSERTFGTRSCAFPSDWPVVLVLSRAGGDMCGAVEEQLITRAGASPNPQRAAMLELSEACMASAAASDFANFAAALERYMDIAATLFASVQAGRYRNERIASRVALAQRAGLRGVGQSSWGPTVFGFADSDPIAQRAAETLRAELKNESVEVIITRAAHQGASWRQVATGVQHAS
ncbi:MAG: hypothetical protein ACTHK7_24700 [Aureliella sp.]